MLFYIPPFFLGGWGWGAQIRLCQIPVGKLKQTSLVYYMVQNSIVLKVKLKRLIFVELLKRDKRIKD